MRTPVKRSVPALALAASLILAACLSAAGCAQGPGDAAVPANRPANIENGMAQPMLAWSDLRAEGYTNEGSDILRFCVYVETDNDTDNDGKADLVKVFAQVPRTAAEGGYDAGVIYDPLPYDAGFREDIDSTDLYEETPFDYKTLYKDCEKRTPASSATTLEAGAAADPADWNYLIPGTSDQAYESSWDYNYFLVRGFAVVKACGIGTYGSEGFELCGTDLERDSHRCVVEWLAGKRAAYTDKTGNVSIAADWSNGNVAMTGMSYGGTLPFEVATTGVEGLKTIIPVAGIANWYEYTNCQGIPIRFNVNYTDSLAATNCGGVFTDDEWTTLKPGYGSYLWQVAQDEDATNGDYGEAWDAKNFADDYKDIKCSALIVQGLNDANVDARQADLMMKAFANAGRTKKLILHQGDHIGLEGMDVNGELWDEILNKWLCRYLYGEQNGIENMAEVTVQSNLDGTWKTYGSWREFDYRDVAARAEGTGAQEASTAISSAGVAEYASAVMNQEPPEDQANADQTYYTTLDEGLAARYTLDVPAGTTVFGVPEVHARLATEDVDRDGLMITAVLVDSLEDGGPFDAFASTNPLNDGISVNTLGAYELGGGAPEGKTRAFVQLPTEAKIVSYGWTDLQNPGCGADSSEYTTQAGEMEGGAYYDYTFYMVPTVYTLAPGHKLTLVLTTWDPYRAFLDEDYSLDTSRDAEYSFFTYGYAVDNASLKVRIPVR